LDERYARTEGSDEDDEDEPEYLFPNRTPAPAHAFRRHRHPRSKSLSEADYADRGSMFSWHLRPEIAAVVDDEGDDDGSVVDEVLMAEHEQHDEMRDCDKHGGHLVPNMGVPIEEALVRSEQGHKLITYDDLPIWWRNNQYLHTGYRFIPLGRNGPIPLIKSAFRMHNETVNIHSHFVPTLFILGVIPFIVWRTPLPDAHWIDTAMLISYLLAAMSCLVSSAGWHVLSGCANKRWFEWGACVDYIGISWLIAMSFNTVVYNAFYCRGTSVLTYTCINVAFGGLGSYLPFQKWFNQRKNKPWRILFFLCLNVAMFAPMVALFLEHGRHVAGKFVAPFFYSVAMYLLGLCFYAFHFPECAAPGKFDRFGASHQLWHLSIVAAIILHYRAIFVAYDARWSLSCAAPDAGSPVPLAISAFLFGK
jgi:adiponectin receptor